MLSIVHWGTAKCQVNMPQAKSSAALNAENAARLSRQCMYAAALCNGRLYGLIIMQPMIARTCTWMLSCAECGGLGEIWQTKGSLWQNEGSLWQNEGSLGTPTHSLESECIMMICRLNLITSAHPTHVWATHVSFHVSSIYGRKKTLTLNCI